MVKETLLLFGLIGSFLTGPTVQKEASGYQITPIEVTSIKVHKQDAGHAFAFYIDGADYKGKGYLTSIQGVSDLSIIDKIEFEYKDSNTFTGERYLNVWGHDGAFMLRSGSTPSSLHDFTTELNTITVKQGCQFPSFSYGSGASSTKTCYEVARDMVFVNDGNGSFTYDRSYGDYSAPTGYDYIPVTVTSLREQNHTDMLSFLQFVLSDTDYAGLSTYTSPATYKAKYPELAFLNYIYVNGKSLASDSHNSYTMESFFNLFGVTSSFAIRTWGNNTGCYYNSRVETVDLTAYEVVIRPGCAFPSYRYLSGAISTPTCYLVTKTARFMYENGAYVSVDDYKEPNWIETTVTSVSSHGSGNDTAIDITISGYDFPSTAGDVVFSKSKWNYSWWDRIAVKDVNGAFISINNERFANVWNNRTSFSIRKPTSHTFAEIGSVIIYGGCEFPSYYCYAEQDNSRFKTTSTVRFISNGDGTFYLCNEVSSESFATSFLAETGEVCKNYDGVKDNKAAIELVYSNQSAVFAKMSKEEQAKVKAGGTANIDTMLARYDYLLSKYSLTNNFLGRVVASSIDDGKLEQSDLTLPFVLGGMAVITLLTTALLVYRRRRAR